MYGCLSLFYVTCVSHTRLNGGGVIKDDKFPAMSDLDTLHAINTSPVPAQCKANVVDVGFTLSKHWANILLQQTVSAAVIKGKTPPRPNQIHWAVCMDEWKSLQTNRVKVLKVLHNWRWLTADYYGKVWWHARPDKTQRRFNYKTRL